MQRSHKNLFSSTLLACAFFIVSCTAKKDPGPPPTIPPSSDSGNRVLPSYDTAPGADASHIPSQLDPKPEESDKYEALTCGDLVGTWTVVLDSSNKRSDEWTLGCVDANTVSIAFGKNNRTFKSTYPPENGMITNAQAKFSVKTLDHAYTIELNKQEGKIVGTTTIKKLGTEYAPESHSVQLKKKG